MLVFLLSAALAQGDVPAEVLAAPSREVIRRLDGTVYPCIAQKVVDGPENRVGKFIVVGPIPAPVSDGYGFGALINRFRASAGLRPLAYDPSLTNWAAQNNSAQCSRGLGHHVNPGFRQNAVWNYADAASVFNGWLNSPGHRAAMLANVSTYGIHHMSTYWTANFR